MHDDYYLNMLYPLQDKVLQVLASTDNRFYVTGGTALSRAYLNHRFSDDLDFFVNQDQTYKEQVERIFESLTQSGFTVERAAIHESFSRCFIHEDKTSLKVDLVNDIEYRVGDVKKTPFFIRTDTMRNILSNKITALGRLEAKDVVDIIYICRNLSFNWKDIFNEAERKDIWVNPVDTASLLEQFPVDYMDKIAWNQIKSSKPKKQDFKRWIHAVISDIMTGNENSIFE